MTTVVYFKYGYECYNEIDPLFIPNAGDRVLNQKDSMVIVSKTFERQPNGDLTIYLDCVHA